MPADVYVQDGVVYPDEATAVVAMHPNIPEELKRVFITKPDEKPNTKDDNVYEPPGTLDENVLTPRGLEGNRQFQQDPGLETPIQYKTYDKKLPLIKFMGGFNEIDAQASDISPEQIKDLIDMKSRYAQGHTTTSQYKSDLKEYADYTSAGGWGGKTHNDKITEELLKILDEMGPTLSKKIPVTESGNHPYIDMV